MRKGIKLNANSWKTMKGPGDFDPPEYEDGPECPECDGSMSADGEDFVCNDEDCGHTMTDPAIAAAESRAEDMAYEREHGRW